MAELLPFRGLRPPAAYASRTAVLPYDAVNRAEADTGAVMPPKSTWFEPKLRSGLVVRVFETAPGA